MNLGLLSGHKWISAYIEDAYFYGGGSWGLKFFFCRSFKGGVGRAFFDRIGELFARRIWDECTYIFTQEPASGWSRPKRGRLKLNCDAGFREGSASFGCAVRDEDASLVCAFWGPLSSSSPLEAELLAVNKGLQMIMEMQFRDVDIEVDSLLIATLLQNRDLSPPWRIAKVTEEVRQCFLFQEQWTICHIPRECNGVADALARDALISGLSTLCFIPPSVVVDLIRREEGSSLHCIYAGNEDNNICNRGNRNLNTASNAAL